MATEDKVLKKDNLEVNERDDGAAVVFDPADAESTVGTAAPEGAAGGDTTLKRAAEGTEGDGDPIVTETEELAAAETDEEREAIRARRREERRMKREKRRAHNEDLNRQLSIRDRQIADLSNVVNTLQRRSSGTELAQLDDELARGEEALAQLQSTIAEATKQQNGEIVADATTRMMQVGLRLNDLKRVRAGFVQNAQRTATQGGQVAQPSAPTINPVVRANGQAWASANRWYNPNGADLDSRITRQIDDAITQEGFDPTTQEYWDELSDRVERYLPHRVSGGGRTENNNGAQAAHNSARDGRKPGSSVVSGSGRESSAAVANGAKRGAYTISADRVKALKDAGVWDDPAKRNDAIRRYREYDVANPPSRS
jgi:hypothetical protein